MYTELSYSEAKVYRNKFRNFAEKILKNCDDDPLNKFDNIIIIATYIALKLLINIILCSYNIMCLYMSSTCLPVACIDLAASSS